MSAGSLIRRLIVDPIKQIVGRQRWGRLRIRVRTARHKAADRAENKRWGVSQPRVVIVSEGKRPGHFHWYFLEWLERKRPLLRRHLYLDHLPSRLPPGAAVMHAWVQDPVIERVPEVYAQLVELEAECTGRGVAIVHPAAVLSNTKRDILCERLQQVGLRTPRVVIVDETFHTHRGGLGLPLLVRHRWGHGADMRRLDNDGAFDAWWTDARTHPGSWVAAEYVDVRSDDGFYRKYRYVMAGSQGTARHLIVSPNWEVRPTDRIRTPATREQELAFVATPCPHHARFDAARRALEFEIAAFDFSYDVNGGLVVWEVNPLPDLSRPRGEAGEYLAAVVEESYEMLADYYAVRAGLAADPANLAAR